VLFASGEHIEFGEPSTNDKPSSNAAEPPFSPQTQHLLPMLPLLLSRYSPLLQSTQCGARALSSTSALHFEIDLDDSE
jgi:hypothetical protein